MSRLMLSLLGMTATLLTFSSTAKANNADVYALAQGCYVVQSPHNNQYMRLYQGSGSINSGWSFDFKAQSTEQAAKLFFKPSGLGTFMMYGKNGRLLDTRFPADITSGNVIGQHANWRVDSRTNDNQLEYRFTSLSLDKWLRHNWTNQDIYFIDLLNPWFNTSEEWFRLVPQTGCDTFPEALLNVAGNLDNLKGDVNAPVRGSIDPHTHVSSYEFMGGTMMAGKPFHPLGVTKALADSSNIHGPWGSLDLIGNLMAYNNMNYRYDTAGWPNFPYWPNHKTLSHMGYYYKWVERAFLGGQRMMTSHLVENEVLCKLQSTLLPQSWSGTNSCVTMDSIDLQLKRMHEMQDYIDAQAGGIGKGFFRLVSSPQEARQVIADGKMAITLGIEVSELFNCGLKDPVCSQAYVDEQLKKYHSLGVRAMFPIHRFDNQFGGARVEGGLINIGNNLSSGRYFDTSNCDEHTQGQMLSNDHGLFGLEKIIGANGSTNYDETKGQCNNRGLTDLGVYLINRMMDLGILIEVDHMSQESHNAVLDIATARNYSGLISSHSHMHAGANYTVHDDSKRLAQLGGFLATYNSNANSLESEIGRYLDVVENTEYLAGVAFATDMGGIGNQPGPRSNASVDPLNYPFTTEFGLQVDKQVTGNRTFDLNTDGMAHYGFVADHIQDIRERTSKRVYESVMNSAEAYLQMWERAEANNDQQFVNPLKPYITVHNRGVAHCLDISGPDDGVTAGAWVGHYACETLARDQRWLFNRSNGSLANQVHKGLYCIDNNNTPWNNGYPNLKVCNNSSQQTWNYSGQRLTNAGSSNHSLDAYNNGWAGFWQSHTGANQQWELRLDSASGVWAEYRSASSGQCLTAQSAGQPLSLSNCNGSNQQVWKWQPSLGVLISKLDPNLCAVPESGAANGTRLMLSNCANSSSPFKQHADNSFRLGQYALDAASSQVLLWQHHGGNNQRWFATLAQPN